MGCLSSSYNLEITHPLDDKSEDIEWVVFQFKKKSLDAKHYLTENGKPTGNDGQWSDALDDLRAISAQFPKLLFLLEELVVNETSEETRYYAKDGKGISISPVMTWPDFDHDDMT